VTLLLLVLRRSALPVAVLGGLALLRPGLLPSAAASPRAWAAVAAVLLAGAAVRWSLRRTRLRRLAGPVAAACTTGLAVLLVAPSFHQRTLQEPLPLVVAAAQAAPTAAPGEAGPTPPGAVAPEPVPAPAPALLGTAELQGIGHGARGTVRLHEVDGAGVVAFDAIDVEGTVGPSVHLVPRGSRTPDGGVRLGPLEAERGSFTTAVPAGVDLRRGWSVLVWCDPFDVPIAVADLA
jgi:hypothetical protein